MKNQRRDTYAKVANSLSDIQASYRKIIRYLDRRSVGQDVEETLRAELDKQIEIATKNIERLELIKYFSSLALLTEGALVTDDEISEIILSLEELINVCDFEYGQSEESTVQYWADEKKNIYNTIKENLLSVLSYKIGHKKKLGEITIQ
jgi:hypothetical protein